MVVRHQRNEQKHDVTQAQQKEQEQLDFEAGLKHFELMRACSPSTGSLRSCLTFAIASDNLLCHQLYRGFCTYVTDFPTLGVAQMASSLASRKNKLLPQPQQNDS
jgi:hypothetical protein